MRLAVALIALLMVAQPAFAAAQPASPVDRRVDALAAELRCPVCQQLSVKESPSKVAASFRKRIRELVEAGLSDEEVRRFFVARYGEWILLSPPRHGIGLWVWLAPVLLLTIGLAIVVVAVRRWTLRSRRLAAVAAERPEALISARAALARLEDEGRP